MSTDRESLKRAIGVAIVVVVFGILGVSAVGYVGERIVSLAHRAAP